MKAKPFVLLAALISLVTTFAGCANQSTDEQFTEAVMVDDSNDPLEDFNRYMFGLNMLFDKILFRPLAEMYRVAFPDIVQDAIRSILDNARTPVILVNNVMQGDFERAGVTIKRFGVNTVLGVGGIADVASMWGLEKHEEDFGQTLAVWGVEAGPYLMLPIIGPSSPRDAVGRVVDFALDPLNWFLPGQPWAGVDKVASYSPAIHSARVGLDAVDMRAQNIESLDVVESNAIDFYSAIRSLYRQQRADQISNSNGSLIDDSAAPVFSEMR